MELENGYKQTEIGVIPSDWHVLNLGKSSTLKARIGWQGLTTAEYLKSGDYFLITGTDFKDGYIDWDNCVYVEKERYVQDKNIQVKIDDILVTKDGTIGKVAFVDKVPKETTLNSGVFVIRPINKFYNSRYLYYILMSEYFKEFLNRLTAGSTISHLYQKDFIFFDFPKPTLKEQTDIATVLSDTDTWISTLEQLLAKKRQIKQGAMQELLQPKEGWEVKKLGEISKISTGKKNNQDKIENGLYPFFVRSQTIERINSYSFDGEAILIPGEGNIGKIFHYIDGKFDFHQRVYKISNFSSGYFGKYIYRYISEYFGRHAMENSVKATVDSLRLPTFENFEIPFPSTFEEQTRIATILSDIDTEIEQLETKLKKAKQLKQGMMQELLTGRIRLVKNEVENL